MKVNEINTINKEITSEWRKNDTIIYSGSTYQKVYISQGFYCLMLTPFLKSMMVGKTNHTQVAHPNGFYASTTLSQSTNTRLTHTPWVLYSSQPCDLNHNTK